MKQHINLLLYFRKPVAVQLADGGLLEGILEYFDEQVACIGGHTCAREDIQEIRITFRMSGERCEVNGSSYVFTASDGWRYQVEMTEELQQLLFVESAVLDCQGNLFYNQEGDYFVITNFSIVSHVSRRLCRVSGREGMCYVTYDGTTYTDADGLPLAEDAIDLNSVVPVPLPKTSAYVQLKDRRQIQSIYVMAVSPKQIAHMRGVHNLADIVALHDSMETTTQYGVLCEYANIRDRGMVYAKYENDEGVEVMCSLYRNMLPDTMQDIDTGRNVYVVQGQIVKPQSKTANYRMENVELMEVYDRCEYESVMVDANGLITAVKREIPLHPEDLMISGEAYLSNLRNTDEPKKGRSKSPDVSGFLATSLDTISHSDYYVPMHRRYTQFEGEEMNTKEYVYRVRFQCMRDQKLQQNHMLPRVYKMEVLERLPRPRRTIALSEERRYGVLVDYKSMESFGYIHANGMRYKCSSLLPHLEKIVDTHRNRYVVAFSHTVDRPDITYVHEIVGEPYPINEYSLLSADYVSGQITSKKKVPPEDVSDRFEIGYGFMVAANEGPQPFLKYCRIQRGSYHPNEKQRDDRVCFLALNKYVDNKNLNKCVYPVRYYVDKADQVEDVDAENSPTIAYKVEFLDEKPLSRNDAYTIDESGHVSRVGGQVVLPEVLPTTLDGIRRFAQNPNACRMAVTLLDTFGENNPNEPEYAILDTRRVVLQKWYKDTGATDVRDQYITCLESFVKQPVTKANDSFHLTVLTDLFNAYVDKNDHQSADAVMKTWQEIFAEFRNIYPEKAGHYQSVLYVMSQRQKAAVDTEKPFAAAISLPSLPLFVDYLIEHGTEAWWQNVRKKHLFTQQMDYLQAVCYALSTAEEHSTEEQKPCLAFSRFRVAFSTENEKPCRDQESAAGEFLNATAGSADKTVLNTALLLLDTDYSIEEWVDTHLDAEQEQLNALTGIHHLLGTGEVSDGTVQEQLCRGFAALQAFLKPDVAEDLPFAQYVSMVHSRLKQFKDLKCGVAYDNTLHNLIERLSTYDKRTGFMAKELCLQKSANDLQRYRSELQQSPTVYGWYLLWPWCEMLLKRVLEEWKRLLKESEPTLKLDAVSARVMSDGQWNVEFPLSNREGDQSVLHMKLNAVVGNKDYVFASDRQLRAGGHVRAFHWQYTPAVVGQSLLKGLLKVSYAYATEVKYDSNRTCYTYTYGTRKQSFEFQVKIKHHQNLDKTILSVLGPTGKLDERVIENEKIRAILKNRENEIEKINGFICPDGQVLRGRWVALYGQWRVGKTLLLYEVLRTLPKDDAIVFYEEFPNSTDTQFEKNTVKGILTKLGRCLPKGSPAREFIDSKRKECATLEELSNVLNDLREDYEDRPIVMALDEFTKIYFAMQYGNVRQDFISDLRRLIVDDSGCVMLTAGGEMTEQMINENDPNALQKAFVLWVPYLSKEHTTSYVDNVISNPGYLGSADQRLETVDCIYRLTQGNAFLLQNFCSALVDHVNDNGCTEIHRSLVSDVLDGMVNNTSIIALLFNSLYNPLNEEEREKTDLPARNREILKRIVSCGYEDTHCCRYEELKKPYADDPVLAKQFDEDLKALINRDIVKNANGNISINIDLFYELQSRIERKGEMNDAGNY